MVSNLYLMFLSYLVAMIVTVLFLCTILIFANKKILDITSQHSPKVGGGPSIQLVVILRKVPWVLYTSAAGIFFPAC